jgi:hypothetical protein
VIIPQGQGLWGIFIFAPSSIHPDDRRSPGSIFFA